jgi:hypothetical protein
VAAADGERERERRRTMLSGKSFSLFLPPPSLWSLARSTRRHREVVAMPMRCLVVGFGRTERAGLARRAGVDLDGGEKRKSKRFP